MKNQLSAVDIYVLIKELSDSLSHAKIQKIQGLDERGLRLEIHSKKISGDLAILPNYFCISKYPKKTSEKQWPFILQLRKNIKNLTLSEIRQHSLDRILELSIEGNYGKFLLIVELFSKGNFLLCDENKKILGLLERQQWKDRTLNVGRDYEYPPVTVNPFEITFQEFTKSLMDSKKTVVATLAKEINLGGNFAEEICCISSIPKENEANKLNDEECRKAYAAIQTLLKKANEDKKPAIVTENGIAIDVVPFSMQIHENLEKRHFDSFNDAVDAYFSEFDIKATGMKSEDKFRKRLNQFDEIKKNQERTVRELQEKELDKKKIADLIYQNFSAIEKTLKLVKETKDKETLIGAEVDLVIIKKIDKLSLTIEIKDS